MKKYLKGKKVSLILGTLVLVTQSLVILGNVPSFEVEGQSVLTTNSHAIIDMITD